ncbi:MAG: 3-phosphoshikimate 1-carboxyvinyltransferase [Dehalococcoidia bacterium]|nr:MAG: 3-phosphoshikimate 1-carboxyvinyltransferase [Dehalococcoidia bacterium]
MQVSLYKSKVEGRARAPSSKSYTIRGLVCAALGEGRSEIVYPLISDDTNALSTVLGQVGASIQQQPDLWQVRGGSFHKPDGDLFCGDSAATLRFMTALCSLVPGRCCLTAGPSLSKRPVKPLVKALEQLGVDVSCQDELAPVVVNGGRLKGGVTEIAGNISSQFISALLFIAPLAEEGVEIRLTAPLQSKPYILMTMDCLRRFGVSVTSSPVLDNFRASRQSYRTAQYRVEGDWSSASYLLALGAVCGEVVVDNLNPQSLQGDKIILDFLRDMGALVDINDNAIRVRQSELKAIKADLSDCIDLLPTMAILAATASGVSQFIGINRARLKESNRVSALREGLTKMGVEVTEEKDRLTIVGSKVKGSAVDSRGDHRIAMALAVLGSAVGKTIINDAECVAKTFPDFWETLKSIGVKVAANE